MIIKLAGYYVLELVYDAPPPPKKSIIFLYNVLFIVKSKSQSNTNVSVISVHIPILQYNELCSRIVFFFYWDQSLQNLSSTGNTFIPNEKSPLFLNLIKYKILSLHRWFMWIWTTITLHQMCVFLLH